jgi:hypothetical protein
VAVDISVPTLGVARQRVEERGLHNVKLLLGDAQVFEFELAVFDLATSRMGVMFFANPTALHRTLPRSHSFPKVGAANAAQRRDWNTVAGPRWVATPGFRERRNQAKYIGSGAIAVPAAR